MNTFSALAGGVDVLVSQTKVLMQVPLVLGRSLGEREATVILAKRYRSVEAAF